MRNELESCGRTTIDTLRLQLMSDLHLEKHPEWKPKAAPQADVLVLAGDVGSYLKGSLLTDTDFGLSRFAPGRGPWRHVLYVPGNHEYDDLEFDDVHRRLRDACDDLGITWLEREKVVIDGVRFIGTTLWSDFDALKPAGESSPSEDVPAYREQAFRAANGHLEKFSFFHQGERVLAEGIRELSLKCQSWLREALAQPFSGPTVAVTHFAPSLRSADPRFGIAPGTAGFCNSLDHLLPWADLWLHGHLHSPVDYVDTQSQAGQPHRCRVVANPLGYLSMGEGERFDTGLLIEVSRAA